MDVPDNVGVGERGLCVYFDVAGTGGGRGNDKDGDDDDDENEHENENSGRLIIEYGLPGELSEITWLSHRHEDRIYSFHSLFFFFLGLFKPFSNSENEKSIQFNSVHE